MRDKQKSEKRKQSRCERIRRQPMDKFVEHVRKDKCAECLALFEEIARESEIRVYLHQSRN